MEILPTEKEDLALSPYKGSSIDALISQAIDKSVSVDTLERLLAMRRELKAEYAKEQFNVAMSRFQSICPLIKKTKTVVNKSGIVLYKYAPIESIVSQVKHVLEECGFSYSIETKTDTGSVTVTCTAKHILGHSQDSSFTVPLGNKTEIMSASQHVAAALTFAKRYAFCNTFGILTSDQDVDARDHSKTDEVEEITTDQRYNILMLCRQANVTVEQICKYYKVKEITQLNSIQADAAILKLKSVAARLQEDVP